MNKTELLKYIQSRCIAEQSFYNELKEKGFDVFQQGNSLNHLAKLMVASSIVYMHK